MTQILLRPRYNATVRSWLVVLAVLAAAALLGAQASLRWLAPLCVALAAVMLLRQPLLGLFAIIITALLAPLQFSTGTDVALNPVTLLVPVLLVVWLLTMMGRHSVRLAPSRTTAPLLLFLLANLVSLLIGNAMWDPSVLRGGNFLVVQLAQWAIFVFSGGAFLLAGNMLTHERWLHRLTVTFLAIGGVLAIASALVGARSLVDQTATVALIRAPFWVLLAGLAGGQLLFNHNLSLAGCVFLLLSLTGVMVYGFSQEQEAASNWVGIAAVAGVLVWLRFPRLRWPLVLVIIMLVVLGVLVPSVYEFAGGDDEWSRSGGSRLVLIERVVSVTMRNPITGLGPAAYRPYANMTPLSYLRAYWANPVINSHNNYVDIFAHSGLLGLGLFFWLMAEVGWLGWRLHRRFAQGFVAGYVNGMLATLAGIMVVMLLLDWFLPFVYNVGFPGFQASVLVWLFLGGLVAIENWDKQDKDRLNSAEGAQVP